MTDIRELVRQAAQKNLLFLPHAIRQMSRPERMIRANDVEKVVQEGEMIEDYPEDQRGHSCLLLGFDAQQRPIHVVCSPKEDYLAIITVYLPHPNKWNPHFKQRLSP